MNLPGPLLVSAADITRVYGEGEAAVRALDGVTVGFPKGRFTAIMGPSGSGKSTLMHILAGLDRPTSGSVVLDARENILLPLSIAGKRPDQEWVDRLIATVGLGDRLDHRPSELSGGQQQRVAVARALASKPAVVFADEPTGNLDSKSSGELLDLLRRSVDEFGQTVIMVTHDPTAASYADRLLVLADGRIVHDGEAATAEDVLDLMKAVG
jgi:putative ABC transport system ATP-binding protein